MLVAFTAASIPFSATFGERIHAENLFCGISRMGYGSSYAFFTGNAEVISQELTFEHFL